ncbi:uncharacterized protein LOC144421909 isoform X2 [Styela clava]
MPRKNPNRVKREKRYDEQTLQQALATMNDPENLLSLHKVARMYGIPVSTLFYRYSGKCTQYIGHPPELTCEEENELVKWIKNLEDTGILISKYEVSLKVKDMLDNAGKKSRFKDNYPGQDWWKMFKSRHEDLKFLRYRKVPDEDQNQQTFKDENICEEDLDDHSSDEQDDQDDYQIIIQVSNNEEDNEKKIIDSGQLTLPTQISTLIVDKSDENAIASGSKCDDLFYLSIAEKMKTIPLFYASQIETIISQLVDSAESLHLQDLHGNPESSENVSTIDQQLPDEVDQSITVLNLEPVSTTNATHIDPVFVYPTFLQQESTISFQEHNFQSDYYHNFFLTLSNRIEHLSPSISSQLKMKILQLIEDVKLQ